MSGRRTKLSGDIALRFIQACITEKGGELLKLKFDEM